MSGKKCFYEKTQPLGHNLSLTSSLFVFEYLAGGKKFIQKVNNFNPLTPMSDQERIFPYNINKRSRRQVMRVKKNLN